MSHTAKRPPALATPATTSIALVAGFGFAKVVAGVVIVAAVLLIPLGAAVVASAVLASRR